MSGFTIIIMLVTMVINCPDPPVYVVNSSFTVQEGDPFDITLGLDGFPLPGNDNATWFFNNQPLSMIAGIMFGSDFIRIPITTRLDTGTYRVVATNVAGSGEATFDLLVQSKLKPQKQQPEIVLCTCHRTCTYVLFSFSQFHHLLPQLPVSKQHTYSTNPCCMLSYLSLRHIPSRLLIVEVRVLPLLHSALHV